MDARLWTINGKRLTNLRRSELQQVARAIVDGEQGLATASRGRTRGVDFIRIKRKGAYDVLIRSEDWDKLIPFLRNSSNSFEPVFLPPNPPAPVLSAQPNRTIAPTQESPSGGRSFVSKFDYQTQRQILNLLTTTTITRMDAPNLPARTLHNNKQSPALNPGPPPPPSLTVKPASELDMRDKQFYDRVLNLLVELFPEDFPTSPV